MRDSSEPCPLQFRVELGAVALNPEPVESDGVWRMAHRARVDR